MDFATRRSLIESAQAVRNKSYVPYSGKAAGVAILAANGRIYTGCTIEIANWASSLCSGKTALANAVSDGQRQFQCVAVVGEGPDAQYLCGDCRQCLSEFVEDVPVIVDEHPENDRNLVDLLPFAFRLR